MFIAIKDTKLIAIHETEWQCRRKAKGLTKPKYWAWLATVTSEDENGGKSYDFSGEDYEIVETNAPLSYQDKDEFGDDITITFNESGHIVSDLDGTHYHLKWDGSKIIKNDDALTAYQTAEKWKNIRSDRNRRLVETDYLALKDNTLSTAMKEYRTKLRSVPQDNSDPDNITWPVKPT
tara:strand:+ start:1247 stop:1780 length:534 start_codon:yes stop_codon:yes gene_type:complete